MKARHSIAIAVPMLLTSLPALAYESGDVIIRGGIAHVQPHENSSAIRITQPNLGEVPGSRVSVDSNTQLGLAGTYMVSNHWGVELLASTPFSHDIDAAGSLSGAGKLADIKHLPPTVSLQYYPMDSQSRFQPYAGVGLNYTIFFDEQTTSTLTNSIGALGDLASGQNLGVTASSTSLDLDNSLGVAVEVGADYAITERLGLNAGVWWVDLDTTGTIDAQTNIGPVTSEVDVDIDPLVYMIGARYRF
ncbi:outer membrane protein [Tamilnaduibacter salinus]|uniref:Outer membrane protein n=1 Tax=Tamilnaduibacter salinus TaxID=1484056 RepID=A0A2A2HZI8_9GAMM|nr:OmpW family outer membrane protein [Tamilnaduibacter salinus]PAV24742.1 outer membrane protein OmpW [Tamilnaduibacter salinus]PVY70020.1 outer membrane protein [Tamilnaduibacter salinus]